MASPAQFACDDPERHCHPVNFGGKSLSDDREFHGMRGLRIPMCTLKVPIVCRKGYDFGKSPVGGGFSGVEGEDAGGSAAAGALALPAPFDS